MERMEEFWKVQDRWRLFAFGLQQKRAILTRTVIVDVADALKDRFRKLLKLYRAKKDKEFEEIAYLIENFDKDEHGKTKRPKTAKGKKSKLRTFTDKPLGAVHKEDFGLDVIQETASMNEDMEDSKLLDKIAFSASKKSS